MASFKGLASRGLRVSCFAGFENSGPGHTRVSESGSGWMLCAFYAIETQ